MTNDCVEERNLPDEYRRVSEGVFPCSSLTRVSQPSIQGEAGQLVFEQRGCELREEHAQRATHDANIKQRKINDVFDVLGEAAVGVVSAKHCVKGA